jgi:Nuclease-related domain/AAA domain
MARIFPDDFNVTDTGHRFKGELTTLLLLKAALSDQYCIFHGVHWTKIENDAAVYGEIDFLILNPYGKILAIEQKETSIEKNWRGELVAMYPGADGQRQEKKIHSQVARNIQSLRQEFSKRYKSQSLHIEHLLYLPTAKIEGELPVNLTLGRIVDSSESKYLPEIILKILEDNPIPAGKDMADALTIHDFLSEKANVVPQMGVLGHSAKEMTTRLSSGLSEWGERLEFSPFRLWVQGTAGSGKTQLALKELRLAKANKQIAMYLCFNRPLVDAMKLSAPEPNNCMTFHELAELLSKQNGKNVDFQEENIFQKLAQYLVENISLLCNQLDVLIIDEGQDFDKTWGDALITMVKDDGRIIWLEDPSQDLYGRWQTNWLKWVKISSPINYRSPQRLVNLMNALELTNDHLEAGNGYAGMIPNIEPYQDGMEIEATENAIKDLIAEGYAPESIAVLSYRGVATSKVLSSGITKLAGLGVRKFTGYDNQGNTTWSDGKIFVDTLFRFKGQCADAIVLTEIDFDEWTENVKRRLFVGLSRARLVVSLVLTENASKLIDQKLDTV